MSQVNGILADELEIVGFNGAPLVECGRTLPVARRKSDRMHCVLGSVEDSALLSWHDEEEVIEFAESRRWTRLREPLLLPRSCISDPGGRLLRQPMVVYAARSFLENAGVVDWPNRFGGEVFLWRGLDPSHGLHSTARRSAGPDDLTQAACGSAVSVEALLDDWAIALERRFDAMYQHCHDRESLKEVADLMLCSAENRPLRWQAYLRYAMVQQPERRKKIFEAFVRHEFPDTAWEAYFNEIKSLDEALKSIRVVPSSTRSS
jgi:hypothetical protein